MKNHKIIGIIGGMGPQASLALYELLILRAQKQYGAINNDDYPEIIIDSVPVPDFISNQQQQEQAAMMLEERVKKLTNFGVNYITIACNTASVLVEQLQKLTTVPFVSIVDVVGSTIKRGHSPALLLGSPMLLRFGLYQKILEKRHMSYVAPEVADQNRLEHIIRSVIRGDDRNNLQEKIVLLVNKYRINIGIKSVVLGCTELPLIFPTDYPLPIYNSLSILADSLLKRYYKKEVI